MDSQTFIEPHWDTKEALLRFLLDEKLKQEKSRSTLLKDFQRNIKFNDNFEKLKQNLDSNFGELNYIINKILETQEIKKNEKDYVLNLLNLNPQEALESIKHYIPENPYRESTGAFCNVGQAKNIFEGFIENQIEPFFNEKISSIENRLDNLNNSIEKLENLCKNRNKKNLLNQEHIKEKELQKLGINDKKKFICSWYFGISFVALLFALIYYSKYSINATNIMEKHEIFESNSVLDSNNNISAVESNINDSKLVSNYKDPAVESNHNDPVLESNHIDSVVESNYKGTANKSATETVSNRNDSALKPNHNDPPVASNHYDSVLESNHNESVVESSHNDSVEESSNNNSAIEPNHNNSEVEPNYNDSILESNQNDSVEESDNYGCLKRSSNNDCVVVSNHKDTEVKSNDYDSLVVSNKLIWELYNYSYSYSEEKDFDFLSSLWSLYFPNKERDSQYSQYSQYSQIRLWSIDLRNIQPIYETESFLWSYDNNGVFIPTAHMFLLSYSYVYKYANGEIVKTSSIIPYRSSLSYLDNYVYAFSSNYLAKYDYQTDSFKFNISHSFDFNSDTSSVGFKDHILIVNKEYINLLVFDVNKNDFEEIIDIGLSPGAFKYIFTAFNRVYILECPGKIYQSAVNNFTFWKTIGTISFDCYSPSYVVSYNGNIYFKCKSWGTVVECKFHKESEISNCRQTTFKITR